MRHAWSSSLFPKRVSVATKFERGAPWRAFSQEVVMSKPNCVKWLVYLRERTTLSGFKHASQVVSSSAISEQWNLELTLQLKVRQWHKFEVCCNYYVVWRACFILRTNKPRSNCCIRNCLECSICCSNRNPRRYSLQSVHWWSCMWSECRRLSS